MFYSDEKWLTNQPTHQPLTLNCPLQIKIQKRLDMMYKGDWCYACIYQKSDKKPVKHCFIVILTDAKMQCPVGFFVFFKTLPWLSRCLHTHQHGREDCTSFIKHKTVNLQSVTVAFWVRHSNAGSVEAREFANTGFHHTDGECLQEPAPVKVVTLLCFLWYVLAGSLFGASHPHMKWMFHLCLVHFWSKASFNC